MDANEIDDMLAATLADHRLSRGERHALSEVLREQGLDTEGFAFWRHRAFALAREELAGEENRKVVEWLEGVVKLLHPIADGSPGVARVCFSPGPECLKAIIDQLRRATGRVDVCVFTITDDRLAKAILEAHERGVHLRIATDDEKVHDTGSDVVRLSAAGIEVRVDEPEHHMHHKFAVFDGQTVATGSYNWTRSAARHNRENLAICDDARLVRAYGAAFDRLWEDLRDPIPRELDRS